MYWLGRNAFKIKETRLKPKLYIVKATEDFLAEYLGFPVDVIHMVRINPSRRVGSWYQTYEATYQNDHGVATIDLQFIDNGAEATDFGVI